MPKPRPPYLPGNYYHIYNRGRSRLSIFHVRHDYLNVQWRLKRYIRELGLAIIAYCLMPNHYHFLVRQDGERRAGLLPQRIFNGYGKWYNHRYNHSGTIFQGDYRVDLIEDQNHLLHLCRYIHANPVKDGIVRALTDWEYSSYPEWVNLRHGSLVDRAFIQEHFSTAADYRNFVEEYIATIR